MNLLCAVIISFFCFYPEEANLVIKNYKSNRDVIENNLNNLTPNERLLALSIVAPEYSLYSSFSDFFELRTLYVMYLNSGVSDFSVGPFQMKPSFIEDMEKQICSDQRLKKMYSSFIPKGNSREKRKFRLNLLSSWSGQLKYLEMFISIAKFKTESIDFKSEEDKLKHWATMYNAGINCTIERITSLLNIKSFPKFSYKFNYAEVSYEFFLKLKDNDW